MTTSSRQITGFAIQEALSRCDRQRQLTSRLFTNSLYKFDSETPRPGGKTLSPVDIMDEINTIDTNYAKLRELLQEYNRQATVNIGGESMRLSLAVKLRSGADRLERMWGTTIAITEKDRYSDQPVPIRSKDVEYANRQISEKECLQNANLASQYASTLRAAIQLANTTSVAINTLGSLFTEQECQTLFGDNPQSKQQQTQGKSS